MLWSNGACFHCSSLRRISPLCPNLTGTETLQFFLLCFSPPSCWGWSSPFSCHFFPPHASFLFSLLSSIFSSAFCCLFSHELRQLSVSMCNPYWHAQHYAAVPRQKRPDRIGALAWLALHPPPLPSFLPLLFSLLFVCRIAPSFWHSGGERKPQHHDSGTWHPASRKEHMFHQGFRQMCVQSTAWQKNFLAVWHWYRLNAKQSDK